MSAAPATLVCPGCHQPTDPRADQCEHCHYLHQGKLVSDPQTALIPPLPDSQEFQATDSTSPDWYEAAKRRARHWYGLAAVWSATLGQPRLSHDPARKTDQRNDGLATIGWITAILIPFVGLVVGILLSSRDDRRGVPIAITAVVVIVAWIAFWVVLNIIAAHNLRTAGY